MFVVHEFRSLANLLQIELTSQYIIKLCLGTCTRLLVRNMDVKKTVCWSCGADITEYYNKNYNGERAKCPICKIDFPLE